MGQHGTKNSHHPSLWMPPSSSVSISVSPDLRRRTGYLYTDLRNEIKHVFFTSFKKRTLKILTKDGRYYVSELKKLPFLKEALCHIPEEDLKLLTQDHVKALITSLYTCLDSELEKILDRLYPLPSSQQPPVNTVNTTTTAATTTSNRNNVTTTVV
jgi:hypothetical protein